MKTKNWVWPNDSNAAKTREWFGRFFFSAFIISSGLIISPLVVARDKPLSALETITVVATQTERRIVDIPATVDVFDEAYLQSRLIRNLADLAKYEPGIGVSGTGSRFGLSGVNIRGIGDNRVLTLIDGVKVADEFSFGPFLSAQRDFVDLDSIKRIEIIRGPASSLYGSDAIGGVLAFTTKDPQDYLLGQSGQSLVTRFKSGYSSADKGLVNTVTVAAGDQTLAAMLLYTGRQTEETETSGSRGGTGLTRELANPQTLDSQNALFKLAWQATDVHLLRLTVDNFEAQIDSALLSDYGTLSRGVTINSRDAKDTRDRQRISAGWNYQWNAMLAESLDLSLYHQNSTSDQNTLETRTAAGVDQIRRRRSAFEQDITGASLRLSKKIVLAGSEHSFSYGADYTRSASENFRDGGTVVALTNASVFEFTALPTRDFPKTKVTEYALYLQDEMELLMGKVTLIPGLRYDSFDARTSLDALYLNGNVGAPLPENFSDAELTAKVGAVWRLNDRHSMVFRLAQGFKAPPFDDVNVGFTNLLGGYKSVSNPGLESEKSLSAEMGWRFQGAQSEARVTVFYNNYDNFIASLQPAEIFAATNGIDPADGLLTFQSKNLDEVKIKGIELAAAYYPQSNKGVVVRASIAYAQGEDESSGEPLNSIDPLNAVFSVGYESDTGKWGSEIVWSLVSAKRRNDTDSTEARPLTAGYGTIDVLGHYDFNDSVSIELGLFNVTDKAFIRWADTREVGLDAVQRFSQPGRNGSLTLRVAL
ncbi:MAG: TonB-dependent hemoglobin/transferrin/lactoferrin family receptor [Pseudomonadales bacterium]|nr:TonB-dependent hemoglobin/transferrin/lactoferrin family receptor [Pseudomonadales bacterium]